MTIGAEQATTLLVAVQAIAEAGAKPVRSLYPLLDGRAFCGRGGQLSDSLNRQHT